MGVVVCVKHEIGWAANSPIWTPRSQPSGDLIRKQVERALSVQLGRQTPLTEANVGEVANLERLWRTWRDARSAKAQAYAMHQAVVGIDPAVAALWIPRLRQRNSGCSRRYFSRGLELLWRARERGEVRGEFAIHSGLLAAEQGDFPRFGAGPARTTPRCEGRHRASSSSTANLRSGCGGGSGSDGGGDDSGGGGGSGDSSDGDSSGSGRSGRGRVRPATVSAIAAVVVAVVALATFLFGPLNLGSSDPAPVIIRERVLPTPVPQDNGDAKTRPRP